MTKVAVAPPKRPSHAATHSVLARGELPIEELAFLAAREGKRPRPIYGAHKWFARRAGSSFRALLVASAINDPDQFWNGYYGDADLTDVTVLDPFVGGGTSVVEASRLGARAIGTDIDAIACAVTGFELATVKQPDPTPIGEALARSVAPRLSKFYETTLPDGEQRDVLHYFWVQTVECVGCEATIDAHPHYRLAHESSGTKQWTFCQHCGEIHVLPKRFKTFACTSCKKRTSIGDGPESRGKVTCGSCGTVERLIDRSARTQSAPTWKLFAIESIPKERLGAGRVNMVDRIFSRATLADRNLFIQAGSALSKLKQPAIADLDDVITTEGRSDDRLVKYGYERFRDLFNDRQQLHLNTLLSEIDKLDEDERRVASIAFSDHLTKNCMLTCYAFGWRRLVPLFAFRAYRHITRPVEINPWLAGVGRGTYPNAIKQSARAVNAAKNPTELLRDGGEQAVSARAGAEAIVANAIAQELPLDDDSVDLVMTDPPYFDNIDYSELADFYRPWMRQLGLIDSGNPSFETQKSLASKGRGKSSAESFSDQLLLVADELTRVLKPNGLVTFTFRHNIERGWSALSKGLHSSGKLRCVQVFPMLAEGVNDLHTKEKTGVFDAVFVLTHGTPGQAYGELSPGQLKASAKHAKLWADRLKAAELPIAFRDQDRLNFEFAARVGASLGMFD